MGFTAALLGLTVLALLLTAFNYGELRRSAHSKALALGVIFFAALVAAFLLAPTELISRFGTAEFSDGIRTQDRLLLWKESFALVRAYPLFGAGLGGYESAFLTYKVTFPLVRDAYAHNDYLQYLIELGGLGYALAAMAAAGVLWRAVKMAVRCRGEARIVSAACCGAFAAILLHSTVDFSLYVPANALLLAWVAGVAASVEDRGAQHEVILPARRTVHYETRNHIIPA
jgi:O-antigen ligase